MSLVCNSLRARQRLLVWCTLTSRRFVIFMMRLNISHMGTYSPPHPSRLFWKSFECILSSKYFFIFAKKNINIFPRITQFKRIFFGELNRIIHKTFLCPYMASCRPNRTTYFEKNSIFLSGLKDRGSLKKQCWISCFARILWSYVQSRHTPYL